MALSLAAQRVVLGAEVEVLDLRTMQLPFAMGRRLPRLPDRAVA